MAPFFRGHKVVKTLLRSSQLPTYSTVQMDSTLFANNSQHCWMSHVASVCIPCCIMLRVVRSRYIRLHTLQHGRNSTTLLAHCWELLRPFAHSSGFCWIVLLAMASEYTTRQCLYFSEMMPKIMPVFFKCAYISMKCRNYAY